MKKLQHIAASKIHAIGLEAPVDPSFLQPRKGSKNEGGQSFGEMENWCLHGVGANKILNDLYGMQSDDAATRENHKRRMLGLPIVDTAENKKNNNNNDAVMMALLRSLGVELVSDAESNTYELKPLTDSRIRSFSILPMETVEGLHNPNIFGTDLNLTDKADNKYKWGWIDLGTKIIHPTWIEERIFSKYASCDFDGNYRRLSPDIANAIIDGNIYLGNIKNGFCSAYYSGKPHLSPSVESLDADTRNKLSTGMDALVELIESIDMPSVEMRAEATLASLEEKGVDKNSGKYLSAVSFLAEVQDFIDSGNKVSDYIITSFPIMPQSFRVKAESSTMRNSVPDFDYFYTQIMNAVRKVNENCSTAGIAELYRRIRDFVGYGATEKDSKYKNVLTYFTGKNDADRHGKIRSSVQSKRVFCSGRAVVIPARYEIKPTEIGVPVTMLVKMAKFELISYFSSKANALMKVRPRMWTNLFTQLAVADFDAFRKVYTTLQLFSSSLQPKKNK